MLLFVRRGRGPGLVLGSAAGKDDPVPLCEVVFVAGALHTVLPRLVRCVLAVGFVAGGRAVCFVIGAVHRRRKLDPALAAGPRTDRFGLQGGCSRCHLGGYADGRAAAVMWAPRFRRARALGLGDTAFAAILGLLDGVVLALQIQEGTVVLGLSLVAAVAVRVRCGCGLGAVGVAGGSEPTAVFEPFVAAPLEAGRVGRALLLAFLLPIPAGRRIGKTGQRAQ